MSELTVFSVFDERAHCFDNAHHMISQVFIRVEEGVDMTHFLVYLLRDDTHTFAVFVLLFRKWTTFEEGEFV